MVYDPIRDCDMPSPAVSRRPSLWETPPPIATNLPQSSGGGAPPQPPAFGGGDRRSPAPSPSLRPPSGAGLRSLLNDEDAPQPRRGSDATVASADDEYHARPRVARLINDSGPSSARPGSDRSPSLSSPSNTFVPPPLTSRVTRSPLISPRAPSIALSSPASASGANPFDHPAHHAGPSSRRSSIDTQRSTMPPPAEPVRHDSGGGYSSHSALHSPVTSASVSPRGQAAHLQPSASRRPSSASRTNGGSAARAPPPASPDHSPQRAVPEASPAPAASPVPASNGGSPARKYAPDHPLPRRRPITHDELERLRSQAVHNNPLRWKLAENDSGPSHSRGPSRRGSSSSGAGRPPYSARNGDESAAAAKSQIASGKHTLSDAEDENRALKVARPNYSGNAATVASHYNSRQEVGVEQREFSPIIGLKKFNNWIKSVLIGKFTFRGPGAGAKVLDIGCGKGGDLNKWKQARISLYVGMDIAATSIDQARQRYNTMRGARFDGFFVAHDCYSRPISEVLPDDLQRRDLYDNVSLQFCMHYAFETASKARMMMENVSRYLRRGGVFIGTIPNSTLLLERLEEIPEGEDLEFGNSCYRIAFKERQHAGVYGHEYRFYLEDAVEDVPEYIVDWENFVSLAREYGLELVYRKTFNDVLQDEQGSRDFGPLLGKMGVVNEYGESAMDSDQWEAANLYMAFAFEKV